MKKEITKKSIALLAILILVASGVFGLIVYCVNSYSGSDKVFLSTSNEDNFSLVNAEDFQINGSGVLTKYKGTNSVLKKENFPDTITKIGANAFTGTSVVKVELPDSINEVMINSFWNCQSLEEIVFGANVAAIGNGSLAFCPNLKKVVANFTDSNVFKLEVFTFQPKTFEIIVPYGTFGDFSTELNLGTYKSLVKEQSLTLSLKDSSTSTDINIDLFFGQTISDFPTLSKVGYVFEGWFDTNNRKFENGQANAAFQNTTLSANWTIEKYSFKIVNENGNKWINESNGLSNMTAYIDFSSSINLEAIIYNYANSSLGSKAGYIFKGLSRDGETVITNWNTIADEGENYSEIEIFPVWGKEKYDISYVTQLDNVAFDDEVYYYGDNYFAPTSFLERQNFVFGGWYKFEYINEEEGLHYDNIVWGDKFYDGMDVADVTPNIESNGAVTLLAKWIPNEKTISFNTGFESIVAPINVKYDNKISGLPQDVERAHYIFAGWKYNDVSVVNGERYSFNGNITLIAQWTPITYNISFNLNGGELSAQSLTYNIETPTFSLPTPKKFGYHFSSWLQGGVAKTQIQVGSYGDMVLDANWLATIINLSAGSSYTVSDKYAIVNLSNLSANTNIQINISSNVDEVTFLGVATKHMSSLSIVVESRQTPMYIGMQNISMTGQVNSPALDASNAPNLTLELSGVNQLQEGAKTINNRSCALKSQNLTIIGDELSVYGASTSGIVSGKNDGFNGGSGIIVNGNFLISNEKLTVRGGYGADGLNGVNGVDKIKDGDEKPDPAEEGRATNGWDGCDGDNGGRGGVGGSAIDCNNVLTIEAGSIVNLRGGDGGNGGDGGDGENGENGGDGCDAVWFGESAKRGGNGGNAGNAGYGGAAGLCISGTSSISGNPTSREISYGGKAGSVGTIGKGGAKGLGGKPLVGDKLPSGRPGIY